MKKPTLLMAAAAASVAFGAVESKPAADSVEVASGLVSRSLDTKGGHLLGRSYKTADGTEFMRNGSPEFAFRLDGKMYAGWSVWKDVKVEKNEAKGGACTTTVAGISYDGKVGIELAYTTYPGIALVRKTLAIANKGDKDVAIEDVDVETFRLATLGCTNSRVMRHFGRYREEGSVYIGDWNDPLVVVHDYNRRCGIAVGNEGVSTMKRTTAFQDGSYIVSGTPHVGERYPFRKWLKPGESWTAMPVFTAPYSKCPDPSRVVEGAVSDYVRRHMGVRVEAIPNTPMFVYNTWVPFLTHIDAKLIRELADAAAECGIEEFVIDDGWQINISDGKYGRGDWAVDEKKFPGGLKPVFDYIKSKGMRPGLWLSLAWADPASAPMKEHPEWFVKDKAGNLSNLHTMRGTSRTACMATPWREYIRDRILGLVRDHGLAYVKLDLAIATSAYVYDDVRTGCYAKDHPGHRGHEDSYDAIFTGCMKLFDELHEAAPDLFIDCTFETAGKTFLMDYGIAKHAEGNWLSNIASSEDGQLYVRSLAWGRTPALPATSLVIGNLHMNGNNHLLAFKSLAGTLPIMLGDPRKLTPAERAEYREWSSWLKGLEARHGIMSFRQDLPGFGEPQEGAWDGFARINTETKSGGLVGVFRHNAAERSRRVTVRGLKPDAKYDVLKGAKGEYVAEMTGRELEEVGFEVVLPERCDGELYELSIVPEPKVVSQERMKAIYEEVKTPYKAGMILLPGKNEKIDNPCVFRHGDEWYMIFVVFDGKGYETHIAKSADLVKWKRLGMVFSRASGNCWDAAQADGWPLLLDPRWDGPNTLGKFDGRYWMMYIGGQKKGYETDPLSTGVAWTDDPSVVKQWTRYPGNPVLSPTDADAREFERKTIYKHYTVEDPTRACGGRFVDFYNAKQKGVWRETIGMAVSDDLLHWRRFGSAPVISDGDTTKFAISGDPMIRRIGDTWVMFYFGCGLKRSGAFDTFACSYDLRNWTKWDGAPLVEPSEPYDSTYAHKPWVIKHEGVVYHFYCAVGDKGRGIALATSKPLSE